MQIDDIYTRKIALGKAYTKRYDEIFSNYLNTINSIQSLVKTEQVADKPAAKIFWNKEQAKQSSNDTIAKRSPISIQAAADKFYKEFKAINHLYETEKYKLDIQEEPNIHTMTSTVNYKQKIMFDDMNEQISTRYEKLNKELKSGKYNFFEKAELKKQFKEFEANLKEKTYEELRQFRIMYYEALMKKDNKTIDNLENSLLSNLLSKS